MRNSLLDDAAAAFLDSVSERAFDEPLLAILRAQGFGDLHLVHGQREFGKDVIGRHDGEQWAWQSKAGDISQADWREMTGQLDELRLVNLGHGAFDADLPRRPVLVTTGRLTGNAPDLYRDYNERARKNGEPELALWDRDELLGMLSGNPDAILRGSIDGQFLAALGAVDEQVSTMQSTEVFSRRWTAWEPSRLSGLGVVEAAVVCERFKAGERLDLACHLALCLLRGAWASAADDEEAVLVAKAAGQLFESYALALWEECDERLLREKGLVGYSGFSAWVTYPVRCMRVAEIIGLLSLRLAADQNEMAVEMAQWLVQFRDAQPGTAHPISDLYAVSLVPSTLAIASQDPNAARSLLRNAAIWLCDAYAERLGLAGVDASPDEEIRRLIGAPLEVVELERRRDSSIATIILDLCAALGLTDLYEEVFNDVLAVGIYPRVLRMVEGPDEYLRTGEGNRLDPNVDFAEHLEEGSAVAPHHADSSGQRLLDANRSWDLLAISSATRDRHFFQAMEDKC
jgi:hypothetical protein